MVNEMGHAHPEANTSTTVNLTKDERHDLVRQVEDAIQHRNEWENNLTEWYDRRMGVKKKKTWPWPGCSNINIPIPDKLVRRQKPMYLNSIFGNRPIVTFEPAGNQDPEKARRYEWWYQWLVTKHMGHQRAILPMIHRIDAQLTYGKSHIKVIWDYQCERKTRRFDSWQAGFGPQNKLDDRGRRGQIKDETLNQLMRQELGLNAQDEKDMAAMKSAIKQFKSGERMIDIQMKEVKYNGPKWCFVDARDLIVPWDATDDVDDLPWICHRQKMKPSELIEKAKSGLFDLEAAKEAKKAMGNGGDMRNKFRAFLDQRQYQREGISDVLGDPSYVEVWEIYFIKTVNDETKRYVVTVSPDAPEKVLRMVEFPYEHGQWPFTNFNFETNEPRWYGGRGIPEVIQDLHAEINTQHNNKLDGMAIRNIPTYAVNERSTLFKRRKNFSSRPGSWLPVRRPDDIQNIGQQITDFSYDNEERNLKFLIEEYIGVTDFAVANQKVERRTAREVEEISEVSDQIASLDIALDKASMQRVHGQTIALWAQYGDSAVMVRLDPKMEAFTFNRWELYEKFDFVPSGTLNNSTARQRAGAAMQALQLLQIPQAAKFLNVQELVKDYVENATDFRSGQRYVMTAGQASTHASGEQISEISWMEALGQVHPVDLADNHEVHMQVLQQAIQNKGNNPLLLGHMALHMIASGNTDIGQQMLQSVGMQVVQEGNKLMLQPVQQQPGIEGGAA